eukprot:2469887-Amphidinium_carterae.1
MSFCIQPAVEDEQEMKLGPTFVEQHNKIVDWSYFQSAATVSAGFRIQAGNGVPRCCSDIM